MVSFLANVKFFRFWPITMDYSPVLFLEVQKKAFEKRMPPYSNRRDKSNGACLSHIAPLSAELRVFEVYLSAVHLNRS